MLIDSSVMPTCPTLPVVRNVADARRWRSSFWIEAVVHQHAMLVLGNIVSERVDASCSAEQHLRKPTRWQRCCRT